MKTLHTPEELKNMLAPLVLLIKDGWKVTELGYGHRDNMPFARLNKDHLSIYVEVDDIEAISHYFTLQCPKCDYKAEFEEDFCPECDLELEDLGTRDCGLLDILNGYAEEK